MSISCWRAVIDTSPRTSGFTSPIGGKWSLSSPEVSRPSGGRALVPIARSGVVAWRSMGA
jgi:hypothetical protein